MPHAPKLLGGLTPSGFLERHWQREPLLVRGALRGALPGPSPSELAGLACEEDVDSRLVVERPGQRAWDLRYGPFAADDFRDLPDRGWTLLVQEVDRLLPDVAALLERFRFVPNWRIDDVMVSYAAPGGGVGAHVDNYDVFLIQGAGRRRWRIGRRPVERERLVRGVELRVLAEFRHDEEWVLEPGDLLYLPPRLPHEGVALEPCTTYSIGFRAPSAGELLTALSEAELHDDARRERRYADAGRRPADDPGEITAGALRDLRDLLLAELDDPDAFGLRLGCAVTRPGRRGREAAPDPPFTTHELERSLRRGAVLHRSAISRFAWIRRPAGAVLFVGGQAYPLDDDLAGAAALLCGRQVLDADTLAPHLADGRFVELLAAICNRGFLIPETAPGGAGPGEVDAPATLE